MNTWIPLNKPYVGSEELANVRKAVDLGHFAADGPFSQELALTLSEYTRIRYSFMMPSASGGLELSLRVLGARPGSEVVLPSFTMSSTANAVISAGYKPVFCDIEDRDLALDPKEVIKSVTRKTAAILVVHYGGRVGSVNELRGVARDKRLMLVEDAACALGTFYEGRAAGGLGDMGIYSFHETKNVMCGEGGALMTDQVVLADKIEIIRDHGTNRSRVLRGMASSYNWQEWGGSFMLGDVLAAIALAQLRKIGVINEKRVAVAENYYKGLEHLADKGLILPRRTEATNWHIFYVMVPVKKRDQVMKCMNENGVAAYFHYLPLHNSPMGKRLKWKKKLPVTERVAGSLIRLPIYPGLTTQEQEKVIDSVRKAVKKFI